MLVLSRRENEEIVFPSLDITVSVTHCTNKSVRLGVKAPRHIRIVRGELELLAQTAAERYATKSEKQRCVENIQHQIDAIKLAVQLAQTQLDHQHELRCRDALTYALEAIAKLESSFVPLPKESEWVQTDSATEAVHEVSCGYHIGT